MRHAHLIGAQGAGMRALAAVLAERGWRLSGSDLTGGVVSLPAGAPLVVCSGHCRRNLPPDANLVVASDAVPPDNPELQQAAERGIPVRSYFQMVGELTARMQCAAVAGTHGKSSTVGMSAHVFRHAGADPLVFCGATPLGQTSGGRGGRGSVALVEACEFRANFLHLKPRQAVLLGIEHDHFDCYPNEDDLLDAFTRFTRSVPDDGLLIVRADCSTACRVAAAASCRVERFSLTSPADWSVGGPAHRRGCYEFDVLHHGRPLCRMRLQVPGVHNVLNALAAAALARANGIPADCIGEALSGFRGLHRRMECLGTHRGVTLLDDYAHHPTETVAALEAARQMHPGRRLWCVFQPHQALRLTRLLHETAAGLQGADVVAVADVFRAREGPPTPGEADAARLACELQRLGTSLASTGSLEEIASLLKLRLVPGDVLLTMGAGDVRAVAESLVEPSGATIPLRLPRSTCGSSGRDRS
ncbi:MAG: UDP-N-acetylmuramate--L-alanine ligase [Thermoguttaceae bacterium]